MQPLFKIGDIVKIKTEELKSDVEDGLCFAEEMEIYTGKITQVKDVETSIHGNYRYILEDCYEDNGRSIYWWRWSEKWLEPYENKLENISENDINAVLAIV